MASKIANGQKADLNVDLLHLAALNIHSAPGSNPSAFHQKIYLSEAESH